MANSHAERQPNKFQFSTRGLLVVMLLIALGVGLWVRQRNKVERQAREAERQAQYAQVERWIRQLEAPDEAIFSDKRTLDQIIQLRQASYLEQGIAKVHPYDAIADFHGDAKVLDAAGIEPDNLELHGRACSLEAWHLKQATDACRQMAFEFDSRRPTGLSLLKDKHTFQTRIRPLLWRILQGNSGLTSELRVEACRALLAAGDRSAETRSALARIMRSPADVSTIIPKQRADELNEKYQLRLLDDD